MSWTFEKNRNEFAQCKTNLERINFFLTKNNAKEVIDQSRYTKKTKSDSKSIEIREQGNVLFKQSKYLEAIKTYTWSLVWGKTETIASLAYANRSAVLLKLNLYEQCLLDIERAFEHNYPEKLKPKLINRKEDVLGMKNTKEETVAVDTMSKSIKISTSDKYGRHIVAAKNVKIGELLLVESPFASILSSDDFIYCHECLTICYNLIPCNNCTNVLYCGDTCKSRAFHNYHKYECLILHYFNQFDTARDFLALALKVTLKSKNTEIAKLLTHEEDRSLEDLFTISKMTWFVFVLLKEKTSFFEDFPNFAETFKESFMTNFEIIGVNGVAINRLELNAGGYETVRYAAGLYPTYSLFNHSCYPNTFFYHDGGKLVVRALATIKMGEQCFISYGYIYSTTSKLKRQTELQNKYYFTCTCTACKQSWPEDKELDNKDFIEPFGLVHLALLQNDSDLIETVTPIFTQKLKKLEKYPGTQGATCLRQLVVDCYQKYEIPQKL